MAQFVQSVRSFADQIRSMTVADWRELIDQRFRIIMAGIGLEEMRAILRGDPATERPNPRYRAHVVSFIAHIRPKFYQRASTWFSHTFRLGYFTFFFFMVELITGIVLMVFYSPTPGSAYQSILELESNVPFGKLMRDMHRLGAEAMVAFVWLHMFRTYFTGSYKGERSFTWMTGVVLLLLTVFLSFTGYLLPWDQLAYWAVTIGASMADKTPFIGEQVNLLLRGAPDIGAGGLLRFYLLHVILLPLAAILLISVHYYKVAREHSISLPAVVEEEVVSEDVAREGKQRVDLIPDLLTHELFLASLGILFMIVVPMFIDVAPLESIANPLKTPLDTKAPWYFLWIQGMLKLGDPTLMGVILPTILILILLAIPYVDRNPSRLARNRPVAIAWGLFWVLALVVLSYMGTPQYGIESPPATRIVQDMLPEEGVGPFREVPFDQLEPGIYVVGETDPETLPSALGEVFGEFAERITAAAEESPDFNDPEALIIITDWQPQLRKITPRILWTDELGEARSFEEDVYVHEERRR